MLASKRYFRGVDLFFWVPLALVVLFAAFLRLYALDTYPSDFGHDEAQLGYDAWSVWRTGRDHHGAWFPIHFQAFNDYGPGATDYLTAPFVGILGLNETATRLPIALLSIATVFLTGLVGRRWFSPMAGVVAALLLAVEPWHLNYSRISSILGDVPFLIVAALYCFTRAIDALQRFDEDRSKPLRPVLMWFAFSAVCFALMPFSYHVMKLQGPILLGICVISAAPLLWKHKRIAVFWLVLFLILASPVYLDDILRYNVIHVRLGAVSVTTAPDWVIRAIRLYADHYSPGLLFFTGYGGGVNTVRPALYIGELFWPEVILWIAAFIAITHDWLSKRTAFSIALLVTLWFITFPVADSLTIGDNTDTNIAGGPHESRAYNFLPLPELLAGFGAVVIWTKLRRVNRVAAGAAAIGGAALYVLFAVIFLRYYFGPPILETDEPGKPVPYSVGLSTILNAALAQARPCDTIYVEPIFQAYMRVLFAVRYPPEKLLQYDMSTTQWGWTAIGAWDHYNMGTPDPKSPRTLTGAECADQERRIFYATRSTQELPGWTEVGAVRKKIGTPVWRLLLKALPYFHDGRINPLDPAQTMAGYCLPGGIIQVYAIDNGALRALYSVTPLDVQQALTKAASSNDVVLIRDVDGRQLYARPANSLQFHDARGIVYNYVFEPGICSQAQVF